MPLAFVISWWPPRSIPELAGNFTPGPAVRCRLRVQCVAMCSGSGVGSHQRPQEASATCIVRPKAGTHASTRWWTGLEPWTALRCVRHCAIGTMDGQRGLWALSSILMSPMQRCRLPIGSESRGRQQGPLATSVSSAARMGAHHLPRRSFRDAKMAKVLHMPPRRS